MRGAWLVLAPAALAAASCDLGAVDAAPGVLIEPLVTVEEATLLAPDGAADDWLGRSVALSSDGMRALLGAPLDDTAAGANAGSTRVFLRTGTSWAQEAVLLAPDAAATDNFGTSVALSSDGSRALVGAIGDDTGAGEAGSARVFLRTGTTWTEEATLLAPSGGPTDWLGYSVALSADGSRAVVGAPFDDTGPGGADAGSAHVFRRTVTTWALEASLLAPDGAVADYFGASVALAADASRALIGTDGDDSPRGSATGSARVFLRSSTTWSEETTLLAADGETADGLGGAVALSSDGSRAIVGAEADDTVGGMDAGSVRVFARSGTTWTEEATLLARDGSALDFFGYSVALSPDGSRALVGADGDDTSMGGMDAGTARVFLRTATSWAEEATLVAPGGAAFDNLGISVALSSDGSRALVGAYADDTGGGIDAGSSHVFTIALAPNGSTCGGDTACTSGFCTNGVCCGTRCAGGATDCQACSAALTGGASGTCAALSASVAATVICRGATSVCDAAEACSSASTACPPDAFVGMATVCRPASSVCDAAETCTGASAACPVDGFAAASTVCRVMAGACDVPETCTGASAACPPEGVASASTLCRISTGACDAEERCDGTSPACPGDVLLAAGVACGMGMVGTCSGPGLCDGTLRTCPGATILAAGTVCMPATPGNVCDVDDMCDGTTDVCRAVFASATTACGPAATDVCDAPDHCAGMTAGCIDTYLSGVECRASGGACDPAEGCFGDSPSCPPDVAHPAGVSCRASTDTSCDPEETCDGIVATCPADVTTCAPRPDAGPDAGSALDAGSAADAGSPPIATPGCGCRLTPSGAPHSAAIGALLALATLIYYFRIACRRTQISRALALCSSGRARRALFLPRCGRRGGQVTVTASALRSDGGDG